MTGISEFLESYNETLRQEIVGADMPPELLERFTFDSCVKKQDGRAVYFVTQKSDGTRAVLRVTDTNSNENAVAEGTILNRLNHPAIPKVLGVWWLNGRGYLVREHFSGDDLHTYVRKHGVLGREQLMDIAREMCDVLRYIHSQNPAVIHRDIKPENIIHAGKNGIKLIDFGIARELSPDAYNDTHIAGTKPYMAPEQFGSEQTDNRADVYSLGVVMIFLATGTPDKQNLRSAYPYKELVPIIEKCIKKDRDQRIRTVSRLKGRIDRVRRKLTQKILLAAGVCVLLACCSVSAFLLGHNEGYRVGYEQGIDIGGGKGSKSGQVSPDTGAQEDKSPKASPQEDDAPKASPQEDETAQEDETPQEGTQSDGSFAGNVSSNGNMNNGGFACQSEDAIFYELSGDIFKMRPDGSDVRVFAEGVGAQRLYYYNGLLYFTTATGFCYISPEGGEIEHFSDASAEWIYIEDDFIYYTDKKDLLCLYRMDLDGGNITKLNDISEAYYKNLANGRMYFSGGGEGRRLYSCNLDGSDMRMLYEYECNWICVYDDMVYFFSPGTNDGINIMGLDGEDRQILIPGTASYLNVTSEGIFYTTNAGNSLDRASLDGKTRSVVADTKTGRFNIVGEWVFYENRDDDDSLWRVRLDGTDSQKVQ